MRKAMNLKFQLRIFVVMVVLLLIVLLYGCSSDEKVVNGDDLDKIDVLEEDSNDVFIPPDDGLDGAFADLEELEWNQSKI